MYYYCTYYTESFYSKLLDTLKYILMLLCSNNQNLIYLNDSLLDNPTMNIQICEIFLIILIKNLNHIARSKVNYGRRRDNKISHHVSSA